MVSVIICVKKKGFICGISSRKVICLWGQKGKAKVFISSSSDLQIRKCAVFELEMFTELVSFIIGALKYVLVDQKTNWKGDASLGTIWGPDPLNWWRGYEKSCRGMIRIYSKSSKMVIEGSDLNSLQLINVMHWHKAKY